MKKIKIFLALVGATLLSANALAGGSLYDENGFATNPENPNQYQEPTVTDGVSPTCTADGLTDGSRCSVCGEVIKAQETIPALGHSFTNYIYNNDATTEADGTETAVCDHGCGAADIRTAEGTKLTDIAGETANAVAIYAHHNVIVVENAEADIYVYDATGRCIEMRESCPSVEIALQREGIYIVRTGGKVQRVAVVQN